MGRRMDWYGNKRGEASLGDGWLDKEQVEGGPTEGMRGRWQKRRCAKSRRQKRQGGQTVPASGALAGRTGGRVDGRAGDGRRE